MSRVPPMLCIPHRVPECPACSSRRQHAAPREPRTNQLVRLAVLITMRIAAIVAGGAVGALLASATGLNRAHAATLGLHLVTAHPEASAAAGLRAATPGVYLRTEAGFTAGAFRNSYARGSAYAGWTFETPSRWFAVTAGAISGYPARPLMPLLALSTRVPLGQQFAARIALTPKPVRHGTSFGIHLALEQEI